MAHGELLVDEQWDQMQLQEERAVLHDEIGNDDADCNWKSGSGTCCGESDGHLDSWGDHCDGTTNVDDARYEPRKHLESQQNQ